AAPGTLAGFDTRDQFYGGLLGARVLYAWGPVVFDLTGKVSLGTAHEVVQTPGSPLLAGGLPGLSAGSSRVHHDEFAVVPEASFRLIYRLTPHLSLQGGYSFLYLNHAVRPGEQVGRVLVPAFGLPPASL